MDLYLSLGTNEGDRDANIDRALTLLDVRLQCRRKALSSIINTPAWGFEAPDFLNAVVLYDCSLPAEEVLAICKGIEKDMGRHETLEYDKSGRRIYHNRIIDIDILLYGNQSINTPDLTIPHAHMHERDFILQLLHEID